MRRHYLLAALMVVGMGFPGSLLRASEEAPSKEKIDRLIEQMGSGSFAEREQATRELAAIGVPALEALHKAAKSDDAEVRKRAEEIIPKIEIQAESARLLAARSVQLKYKDTPLHEALADFQKKSGYSIQLFDPQGKLKERTITLDTGETSFWHALALFCDGGELSEASLEELMERPPAPGVPGANLAPGAPAPGARAVGRVGIVRPGRLAMNGHIILKDGKFAKLPTDDRSAIRIRALGKADMFGEAPEGEVLLVLDVSAEPRLQWQATQSVRVESAVDDQDQKLSQVIPQVPGVVGPNGGAVLPGGVVAMQPGRLWGTVAPMQFKKGAKAAKSLKELKGVITAQLLTEVRPMITADQLDKSAGKVFKGELGGMLKLLEVKEEEMQTTLRLEFEQPPGDKVVPAQAEAMPGIAVPAPVRLPRPVRRLPAPAAPPGGLAVQVPPPPAGPPVAAPAPAVQVQIGGGAIAMGGPGGFVGLINGLSIQDEKGKVLPVQIQQTQFRVLPQANGVAMPIVVYTLVCQHEKGKGQPVKVVYQGRKRVTVDIPFTLNDVPLP